MAIILDNKNYLSFDRPGPDLGFIEKHYKSPYSGYILLHPMGLKVDLVG